MKKGLRFFTSDVILWIVLLFLSNGFFMLLAWLAYPAFFPVLIAVMLMFSLALTGIGLWRNALRRKKIEESFYAFLSEPDRKHENELIKALGHSFTPLVLQLGFNIRSSEHLTGESRKKALAYEEFIEAWVHEIKTPLSLAALVLDNRRDEMSERVHQRFEHIKYKISEDVDRILYYGRMQASHSDYSYEAVLLSDCCKTVLEELSSFIEEKKAEVITKMGEIRVVTDEKTLQFVLTQIVSNSLKYSVSGKKAVIRLEAGISEDGKRYNLEITDNGPGVPAADLPFIFDKGFTGNHTNRKKATGIGLFLVKHFCDEMQIEIQAESVYGEGLKIILQFPIVNPFREQ